MIRTLVSAHSQGSRLLGATLALLLGLCLAPALQAAETAPATGSTVVEQVQPASETPPTLGMSHDLSPWGMYQNADIVVKVVMIGLAIASIITWTIWIAKGFELLGAKRRLRGEIAALKKAPTLKAAADGANRKGTLANLLVHDALEEMHLSANSREREGIKERVSFRLERLVAACGRNMSNGTGVLATIGSTAPFVGLFGTVWGIMNSFIGIAKTQTTNLAVVAPGTPKPCWPPRWAWWRRFPQSSSTTFSPAPSPATRPRCRTLRRRCCCWSAATSITSRASAPPSPTW
jgi:biopolymer transport protein ExbB